MAREEGNHERAVDHAKQAAAIYHKMGNRQQAECIALMTVAKACYDHEDFSSAMEYAREALALAEAGDFGNARANALVIISNIQYHQKQYRKSEATALKSWQRDSTDTNITVKIIAKTIHYNEKREHRTKTKT